ncbi:MAG: hypothetical protein DRO23_05570 [Thermoprotei archaeon]|nr:MAG: hypothetical protein DRO23_05570 [Thermoprotei archaeon]
MCEFKVVIEDNGSVIAENIVKTFYEGKTLKLVNILNETVDVENAMISSVDVGKEELKILEHPLLGAVFEFLKIYLVYQSKNIYNPLVEELWNRVKSLGEVMLRELWVRSRGTRK